MSKDLYKSRRMYQSPLALILLIPLGMIIFISIFDVGSKWYTQVRLDSDTKDVLNFLLEDESLKTKEDYYNQAKKRFNDLGYDNTNLSVFMIGEKVVIAKEKPYVDVLKQIVLQKKVSVRSTYIGYYNDKDVLVIEKYDEDKYPSFNE